MNQSMIDASSGWDSPARRYPLSEVQRIGYVDENETLKCRRNLGNSFAGHTAFEAGKSYKIASETVKIGRHKTQTNIDGDEEDILVTGQDLVITHPPWPRMNDPSTPKTQPSM